MDNRRSTRMSVVLPVVLSGTGLDGTAFTETTCTMGVNKHGAKLATSYRLAAGDQILVGNPALGSPVKARVTRVVEEGRGFEIGLELLEPQDIWGTKIPPNDWKESAPLGGVEQEFVTSTGSALQTVADDATFAQQPAQPGNQIDLHLQTCLPDPARHREEEDNGLSSSGPLLDTLAGFLRASRVELEVLLAKTREIQDASWQSVQSLLEQLQSELHQKLETASVGFVNDTRKRVQHKFSVAADLFGKEVSARQAALLEDALTRLQAAHQRSEASLKETAEEHQKNLMEASAAALKGVQHEGQALFDSSRTELQKTFDELKQKGVNEVAEELRRTHLGLADELRRRAEVGYEILNQQLEISAKALINETRNQIDVLRQSALATLTREACESVRQQVGFGATALKEAADQTTASLKTYSQQSIESFQKEIGDLFQVAVEKFHKTSESILHDLQSRLGQAARALRVIDREPAGTNQQHAPD